jgi:hypothetical protein
VSKHTPGPWKVSPSWDDWTVVGPNKEEIIFQDGPYQTPTILQPDAQLIAAAPELLKALELIASLPGFEPDEPYGVQALAAIAKATQGEVK